MRYGGVKKFFICLLAMATWCVPAAMGQAPDWREGFHPYRVRLTLARPASGEVSINLSVDQILKALEPQLLESLKLETFAFDRAVLIDPATGEAVGGFKLMQIGRALEIDGAFTQLARGEKSPWSGPGLGRVSYGMQSIGGRNRLAVMVENDVIANTKFAQPVNLTAGQLYLLDYWLMNDSIDNAISVDLFDPARWYFANLPGSYAPPITPMGEWTHQAVLRRATVTQPELRVGTAFTGRCGITDMSLRPVAWKLVANLEKATDTLDLYCIGTGGHYYSPPPQTLDSASSRSATVKTLVGERNNPNPGALLVESGSVRCWSIPASAPLIVEKLANYRPQSAFARTTANLTIHRGTSETLLLAIEGGKAGEHLDAKIDLPLEVRVERLAAIPIFDGPAPEGRKIETRFDALVTIDDPQIPGDSDGIQLLAVTVTAPVDAEPGVAKGKVSLTVGGNEIVVPIETNVSPVVLKPMHHFGTLFGSDKFDWRATMANGHVEDGITVAEFHGMRQSTESLQKKYWHRMIDYGLVPESVIRHFPTCTVTEREGDIPAFSAWDFSQIDQDIDEFVIGRDLPWIMLGRSNGELMQEIRLPDGITYSTLPADGNPRRRQLPADQYYKLVGVFYEALAMHLAEKGVLDRTMFVIDETDPKYYGVIRDYVAAVKAQPHGKRLQFGHTTYKTSTYTQRDPNGHLILDAALDVPMPSNDEAANYFEPELNERFKTGQKHQWVYYVESDHLALSTSGISTIITPLKLGHFGAEGWYCWASFIWSMPFENTKEFGPKYADGPVINPWVNPFYHHGPGVLSFFYPPDPAGPAKEPTEKIVPSYRLSLMRDGIQTRALLEVLRRGTDDAGNAIVVNQEKLDLAEATLRKMWSDHPVQWYISYEGYNNVRRLLNEAVAGIGR